MKSDDLPLFAWCPPEPVSCVIIAFPSDRRIGKARDVAAKLSTKSTARHVAQYREQVTNAVRHSIARLGLSAAEQERQAVAFWRAVEIESARLTYRKSRSIS